MMGYNSREEIILKLILKYLSQKPLFSMIIFVPLALLAEYLEWGSLWVFIFSILGIVPLAGLIGDGTEALAFHTGPKIGGLLNATLGNAAELIITLVAIRAGLLDLVKASITGSIIGNLLLVLGFSLFLGGLKNGAQTFNQKQATNHAIFLTITIIGLVIPSLFGHIIEIEEGWRAAETLSVGVAVVMMLLYICGLVFNLRDKHQVITYSAPKHAHPNWSIRKSVIILGLATGGVVWISELLVGAVEPVTVSLGVSEFFLGVILIPIVGNVAEHLVAVQVAMRNNLDLSVEIAVSSSAQIALFVAPLLVFISLAMGHPLTLIFNQFELLALGASVIIAILVSSDGESNWFEGIALLGVYLILGLAFFLLPSMGL